MQIMNQYLLTQFGEMVSKVMTIEIQRQLAPMLAAKLDNLQQHIQLDVTQKLSAFDLMIKENIAQACKSKVGLKEISFTNAKHFDDYIMPYTIYF